MKRWLILLGLLAGLTLVAPAHAQFLPISGWCENGNVQAIVSGLPSTTRVQASYPLCTVIVIVHGGGGATIYSNPTGTPLSNPFTANANGQWLFYTTAGSYDVTITGGTPALPGPVLFSSLLAGNGGSGVTTVSIGNLSPIFTAAVANPTTTPALSFTLSSAAANSVLGNCTGVLATPTYCTLTSSMLPAPGSDTQMIFNTMGAFGATTGLNWNATNRSLGFVNAGNNGFLFLQPATISFNSSGGTTAPYISTAFGALDIIAGSSTDIHIGQGGNNTHLTLPGSDFGRVSLGQAASSGSVWLNDGTSMAGTFQGPLIIASNGAPETNVTGRIASLYLRTDGSNVGTSLYLKEVGTGNTGWKQFAMQDDIQTITNKSFPDTTTTFVNTAAPSKILSLNLAGATAATSSTLSFVQTVNRVYTFPNATGTVSLGTLYTCGTLAACSPTIRLNPQTVVGSAALNNASPSLVTITGISPAFTSSTTYSCTVSDQTSAAHPSTVTYVSGASFTITTGTNTITDTMSYVCAGY